MLAHPLFSSFVAAAVRHRDEIAADARTPDEASAQAETTSTIN
jgi:hypothetical protein